MSENVPSLPKERHRWNTNEVDKFLFLGVLIFLRANLLSPSCTSTLLYVSFKFQNAELEIVNGENTESGFDKDQHVVLNSL